MFKRKYTIMAPGPTEIPWRVIQAMMKPSIIHYAPDFNIDVLDATLQKLKKIFQTKNEVIAVPGSGRVALEIPIASTIEPGDKILCIEAGEFGPWMTEMARRIGADVEAFQVDYGKPIDLDKLETKLSNNNFKALTIVHNETSTGAVYPIDKIGKLTKKYGILYFVDTVSSLGGVNIKTDEWNIDFNMSASHKCLAAPIGLALVAISERGWEAMENRKKPSTTFSYDLLRWKKQWIPKERGGELIFGWRRQPITMPVHLVYALEEAVNMILEEGLENVFKRHQVIAKAVREGIKALNLKIFPEEEIASDTVTAIRIPNNMEGSQLRNILKEEYGIIVGGGLGKIDMLRVGHMGIVASTQYILPFFLALELTLAKLGYKFEKGVSIETVKDIIKKDF